MGGQTWKCAGLKEVRKCFLEGNRYRLKDKLKLTKKKKSQRTLKNKKSNTIKPEAGLGSL